MGSKRRRLALSCVDCRRRKVKCDRTYPSCIRCQKGGHADTCTYVSYDDRQSSLPTPTEDSPDIRRPGSANSWQQDADTWEKTSAMRQTKQNAGERPLAGPSSLKSRPPGKSIQELEDRVEELESMMKNTNSRSFSINRFSKAQVSFDRPRKVPNHHVDQMQLRGKSFRTQYHGPSNATSLLLQFEPLSKFTKQILTYLPNRGPVRENFKRIRASREKELSAVSPHDIPTLSGLLPSRQRVDAILQEYLSIFEHTYRILHVPTFMQRYEAFWSSPQQTTVTFLIQLLAVMAVAYVVTPGAPREFIGRSTEARDRATQLVSTAEAWLATQSQKHVTMEIFQIRILLALAKRMNCLKHKRAWTESGNLVRMAMAMGLHREPSLLSQKISLFHQEMRRRLWFTIVEMDLQAACERGMVATITADQWDCRPPLNIDDESFDEDSTTLPEGKNLNIYTRIAFLCAAEKSLPLRLELLSRVNSIRPSLRLEDAIACDDEIRQALDRLPEWSDGKSAAVARHLSRLLLYEFLLLIHQSFATQKEHQSRHFYPRMVRRDAAFKTMNIYASLPTDLAVTLSSLRDDAIRAALAVAHDIVVSQYTKDDLSQDTDFAIELMDKIVSLLEERVRHFGEGFYSFWVCGSALSLAESTEAIETSSSVFVQKTVDRVKRLNDAMAAQIRMDHPSMENTAASASNQTPSSIPPPPAPASFVPDTTQTFDFDSIDTMNPFDESLFEFHLMDPWSFEGISSGF